MKKIISKKTKVKKVIKSDDILSDIQSVKKKKSKNYYFTEETQSYLNKYQNESKESEKERIYRNYIMPAFSELVHNLISVYGFKTHLDDINHLKSDCISFLYETIHKWDISKGKKAFSYFNVVAKNWLIINTRRSNKYLKRSVNINDTDNMTFQEKQSLADIDVVDSPYVIMCKKQMIYQVLEAISEIESDLKDSNDIKCIKSIKKVFECIDDLDFLNKRAIFVYLREISGLNNSELSSSLTTIRKHYRKLVGPDKKYDLF